MACLTVGLVFAQGAIWQSRAWNLTDGNSVIHVDDTAPDGMNLWTVDGVSQLASQAFWYRTGNRGGQTGVYSLNLKSISQPNANTLITESANNKLDFTISYTLHGGSAGSGISTLTESITVQNLLNNPVDFHLFQYADFNLGGMRAGDTVQLTQTGPLFTGATQTSGNTMLQEILDTGANHGEVSLNHEEYIRFTQWHALTLNDNAGPVGPGDAAFAFEWDLTLAGKGSFTMSLEKQIGLVPVPEPGIWALAVVGLAGLAFRRRLLNTGAR